MSNEGPIGWFSEMIGRILNLNNIDQFICSITESGPALIRLFMHHVRDAAFASKTNTVSSNGGFLLSMVDEMFP